MLNQDRPALDSLPLELWQTHIAPHLHPRDVIRLSRCNRRLYEVAHALDLRTPGRLHQLHSLTALPRSFAAADAFHIVAKPTLQASAIIRAWQLLPLVYRGRLADLLTVADFYESQFHQPLPLWGLILLRSNISPTDRLPALPRLRLLWMNQLVSRADVSPDMGVLAQPEIVGSLISLSVLVRALPAALPPALKELCLDATQRMQLDVALVAQLPHLILTGPWELQSANDARPHWCSCRLRANDAGEPQLAHWQILSSVPDVEISCNTSLEDFGFLQNCRRVTLSGCSALRDVGPLARVIDVTLEHCPFVMDVQALSQCRRVSLHRSLHLRDVSALGQVDELDVSDCVHVVDISALTRNKVLNLKGCIHITHLPRRLERCERIDLSRCLHLLDVSPLISVRHVTLQGCLLLSDLSCFLQPQSQCRYLDIRGCTAAQNTALVAALRARGIRVVA